MRCFCASRCWRSAEKTTAMPVAMLSVYLCPGTHLSSIFRNSSLVAKPPKPGRPTRGNSLMSTPSRVTRRRRWSMPRRHTSGRSGRFSMDPHQSSILMKEHSPSMRRSSFPSRTGGGSSVTQSPRRSASLRRSVLTSSSWTTIPRTERRNFSMPSPGATPG